MVELGRRLGTGRFAAALPWIPTYQGRMSDLRSLHRAISFAESRTSETSKRPQSAGALTGKLGVPSWLAAPPQPPPPRPDNAAALARWVQRRLAPFNGPEAEADEVVCGHEAAAWGISEVLLWLRCSAGLEQYSEAFAVSSALPCGSTQTPDRSNRPPSPQPFHPHRPPGAWRRRAGAAAAGRAEPARAGRARAGPSQAAAACHRRAAPA